MKRLSVSLFMVWVLFLSGSLFVYPHQSASPQTIIRMRHVTMPAPQFSQQEAIRDDRHIARPLQDERGVGITQREEVAPPAHSNITNNSEIVATIAHQHATETQQGQYYWHQQNNIKYAHYVDNANTDWYGFYHGSSFYWTRYHGERWWWYDQNANRWAFWGNGFWWAPTATGALDVYVDNSYYPYQAEQSGVTTAVEERQNPPDYTPTFDGSGYKSSDNRRSVQVEGNNADAFLFDTTTTPPVAMTYLGSQVSKVTFSKRLSDKPLQILVSYTDGSFVLFDADGKSLQAPASPQNAEDVPDESSEAIPDAPSNASSDDEEN